MSQIQSKHGFALGVVLTALSMTLTGFASAADQTGTTQLIINDGKQDQMIINDGKQDQLAEDVKATSDSLEKSAVQKEASQEQLTHPDADKEKSNQDSQKNRS
ncbi:hypothetical protein L6J37_09080 [Photobacterium sp. WH77]|uniref:hypothetical protein n=1 Tax=unclassified Photobacterium TaxID=2628852 RepID=UPI001EDB6D0A|nr:MULTISPECIES: hypothetical protein [unclassified Photobacterium]MCG2836981.1 hypothetical protein [Photobacterium sp. WH77]MCG2844410.1 hypothetical protein [Photobacterium sp. WH80]